MEGVFVVLMNIHTMIQGNKRKVVVILTDINISPRSMSSPFILCGNTVQIQK